MWKPNSATALWTPDPPQRILEYRFLGNAFFSCRMGHASTPCDLGHSCVLAGLYVQPGVLESCGVDQVDVRCWLRGRGGGVHRYPLSGEGWGFIPGGGDGEPETVPVSPRGNVLNLLQPLNRMPGLAAGQR